MKYTVKPTAQFERDYQRAVQKGRDMRPLKAVIAALAAGEPLPPENRDRPLSGRWTGYRECQALPDLLLIYRIDGDILVLTLTRTGKRTELYGKGGTAMKKSTSLRMLLRSPVKTAVTLLLIAAASFLFLYNLLDYAMTKREYDRTYSQYHGYFSVMHPEDQEVRSSGTTFFLSDRWGNPAYGGSFPYELYHQRSLSGEELAYLSSLPYVSKTEKRYMTGGLADFPRLAAYDSERKYTRFVNTSRVVFEATYRGMTPDLGKLNLATMSGSSVELALRLEDVKVLAGNEENLKQSRAYISRKLLYTALSAAISGRERSPSLTTFYTIAQVYSCVDNPITTEDVMALVPGQRYVFVASVDPFRTGSSGIIEDGKEGSSQTSYTYLGDDSLYGTWNAITPLEGEPDNWLETEKFAGLKQMMEIMETDVYTLDVNYLEDMYSLKPYQEKQLLPTQGRMLTQEDSAAHDPVCVISENLANAYGLKLGDKLHLRLGDKLLEQNANFGAVAYSPLRYAENWTGQDFTIVGTFTEGIWTYGENAVFVPLSFLPETADTSNYVFKPKEVSFIIGDADSIVPFRDQVLPELMGAGYIVSFYDGNWPAVSEQLHQAGSLTLVKLSAFAVSAVLVLLLTVYLYILRKKKEFAVMRALGCPVREAQKTLLFPLLALAVPAVALGSTWAAVYARRAAERNAAEFAWLGLQPDTSVPLGMVLLGFGGTMLLLLLLARAALSRVAKKPPLELLQGDANRNPGRRKELPPELTEAVQLAPLPVLEPLRYRPRTAVRHVLSYVGCHLRRTSAKTLLSLFLAMALCFSIGFFTLLRETYRDLYRNVEIHPRFLNGFSDNRAYEVEKSGYVKDPFYEYKNEGCESNLVQDILILTNNLSRVTDAEILWREDKGPEMFAENKAFCVISRDLADELGYELGSRLEICTSGYLSILRLSYPELTYEELVEQVYHNATRHLTVAGIAEEEGMIVYAPVAARQHFGSMFSDYIPLDKAEYTLIDYHKATEFRSWVFRLLIGRQGSFSMETQEADRVYQTYRLLELLYPIAFALALILGGVLPAGVILQSAREASLLRVLGTTKRRTRVMLSLEQLFLCFLGLCLAVAALVIAKGSALTAVAGLVAIYTAAHLLSCAVGTEAAAVSVTRRNVLELLQVKE